MCKKWEKIYKVLTKYLNKCLITMTYITGIIVKQMRDNIVDLKITKGDLRGAPIKQLLGKDFEKMYPPKKKWNTMNRNLLILGSPYSSTWSMRAFLCAHPIINDFEIKWRKFDENSKEKLKEIDKVIKES